MLDKIKATKPAAFAELVRAVLVALISVGWLTVDDATVNTVASVIATLASLALTRFVYKNVTPVAKLDNPNH